MRKNVFIGAALRERTKTNTPIVMDYFILALTDQLAASLPTAAVYTDPRRQGTKLPAVFVSVFHSTAREAMGGVLAVEFQVEVSYLAAGKLDAGELSAAVAAMLEMPRELSTDIGVFELLGRSAAADSIEGRAQMLCRAEARLETPNKDELMRILEQGVKTTWHN